MAKYGTETREAAKERARKHRADARKERKDEPISTTAGDVVVPLLDHPPFGPLSLLPFSLGLFSILIATRERSRDQSSLTEQKKNPIGEVEEVWKGLVKASMASGICFGARPPLHQREKRREQEKNPLSSSSSSSMP